MNWSLDIIKELEKKGKIQGYVVKGAPKQGIPKKSKYGNEKVEVEEKSFDSKREAARYKILNLLLKKGDIGMLARQVEFELNVGGTHSLKYLADFVYRDMKTGELIVEDSKGVRTAAFKKKARLMKKIHGIKIIEV